MGIALPFWVASWLSFTQMPIVLNLQPRQAQLNKIQPSPDFISPDKCIALLRDGVPFFQDCTPTLGSSSAAAHGLCHSCILFYKLALVAVHTTQITCWVVEI